MAAGSESGTHPFANTSLPVFRVTGWFAVNSRIGILGCVYPSLGAWFMRICPWGGCLFSVSAKYQSIIKQWIDQTSSFKIDTQVLVNYQSKYFIVSLLATRWLCFWRHYYQSLFISKCTDGLYRRTEDSGLWALRESMQIIAFNLELFNESQPNFLHFSWLS